MNKIKINKENKYPLNRRKNERGLGMERYQQQDARHWKQRADKL